MAEPRTRGQLERLKGNIKRLYAMPESDERNRMLKDAIGMYRAKQQELGGLNPGDPDSAGALQQDAVKAGLIEAPQAVEGSAAGESAMFNMTPADKLKGEMQGKAMLWRVEDVIDHATSLFSTPEERAALSAKRKIERGAARLDIEARARASGVDPASLSTAETIGNLTPDVAVGLGLGGIGTARSTMGAVGRVASEAALGAATGATREDVADIDAQIKAAQFEGGVAGVLGVVGETPGRIVDFIARDLRQARNSGRYAERTAASEDVGIDLTIGEATNSQAARQAEATTTGKVQGKRDQFYEQRNAQIEDSLNTTIARLNKAGKSTPEIITSTRKAYEGHVSTLRKNASDRFREDLGDAIEITGSTIDDMGRIEGGVEIVGTANLKAELQKQYRLLKSDTLTDATRAQMQNIERTLMRMKPGQTLGQIQRLMKQIADAKAGGKPLAPSETVVDAVDMVGIGKALDKDIEAAKNLGYEDITGVLEDLQTGRTRYGEAMGEIDAFNKRALDNLLGKDYDPSSPDFAKKVLEMDTDSFNQMIRIADDSGPGLGDAIRAAVWNEVKDKHSIVKGYRSSAGKISEAIDTAGMFEDLGDMPMSKLKAFLGVDDPALARRLHNTITVLDQISGGSAEGRAAVRNMRERVEQYSINATSQDRGFIARLLGGEMTPGVMERLLFTPEGQDILSRLGGPSFKRAEFSQAVSRMQAWERQDEQAAEQKEAAAAHARRMEAVGNIQ